MILSNGKTLTPQSEVKYLGFWLDRKLNFKKHCQIRVTNAKKALYAMMSLLNSEWNLLSNATKQLYFKCIVSIADYGSEIWFQSNDQKQKHFLKMFDQLQNTVMKKILGIFEITSIEIMEFECNLLFSKLRLLKKFQKYVIKIAKMEHLNNLIKYVSNNFSENFIHHGFDQDQ